MITKQQTIAYYTQEVIAAFNTAATLKYTNHNQAAQWQQYAAQCATQREYYKQISYADYYKQICEQYGSLTPVRLVPISEGN